MHNNSINERIQQSFMKKIIRKTDKFRRTKNCGMRELTVKTLSISFSTLQCKQSINCNSLNCHRNSNAKSNQPI